MSLHHSRTDSTFFFKTSALEWLSINYRKFRAALKSKSDRRMSLELFEEDYQYFPSLKEIRDGLINAQIKMIENVSKKWNNKTKVDFLKGIYKDKWDYLFNIGGVGDLNKPLTPSILANPHHKVTKHLLYIYSMECFIY